jgi:hypothetical protein
VLVIREGAVEVEDQGAEGHGGGANHHMTGDTVPA